MSIYLALTAFVLFVNGFVYALPFLVKRFAKSDIAHLTIKRGLFVAGTYMVTYNAVLLANLAVAAGLPNDVKAIMWQYMFMFGTAGWVLMGYLVFKTFLDVIQLWKIKKARTRMGEDEDE